MVGQLEPGAGPKAKRTRAKGEKRQSARLKLLVQKEAGPSAVFILKDFSGSFGLAPLPSPPMAKRVEKRKV